MVEDKKFRNLFSIELAKLIEKENLDEFMALPLQVRQGVKIPERERGVIRKVFISCCSEQEIPDEECQALMDRIFE